MKYLKRLLKRYQVWQQSRFLKKLAKKKAVPRYFYFKNGYVPGVPENGKTKVKIPEWYIKWFGISHIWNMPGYIREIL